MTSYPQPPQLASEAARAAYARVQRERIERRQRVSRWILRCSAFGMRDAEIAGLLNITTSALSSKLGREMEAMNCVTRMQLFVTYLRMGVLTGDDFKTRPTVTDIAGDIQ